MFFLHFFAIKFRKKNKYNACSLCPLIVLLLLLKEIAMYETRFRGRVFWFITYQSFSSVSPRKLSNYVSKQAKTMFFYVNRPHSSCSWKGTVNKLRGKQIALSNPFPKLKYTLLWNYCISLYSKEAVGVCHIEMLAFF